MDQFEFSGIVTPFTGNGRKLGYPTANIPISVNSDEGLFAGTVLLDGEYLPALIFIGAPVTLDDDIKRAEAHILDFEDVDLYGKPVVFSVEKKMRDNEKFTSIEALIVQMKTDEQEVRVYFADRLKTI